MKDNICTLFKKPEEQETIKTTTKRFLIHWCIHDGIRNNFWNRWWMVFDAPPCNNHEVPMYFLKKLYCEFVFGEILNYFDILESQGRGGGSSFERQEAHRDPNVVKAPIFKPQGEHVIISSVVKEHVETSTLETINALTQSLIHCTNPLVEEEPSLSHGHMCTSCGSLYMFATHVRDTMDDGLVTDEFLGDTFGINMGKLQL